MSEGGVVVLVSDGGVVVVESDDVDGLGLVELSVELEDVDDWLDVDDDPPRLLNSSRDR